MKARILTFSLLTILFLSGCLGEEIARLEVGKVTTGKEIFQAEETIDLKSGDKLGIWASMDMSYDKPLGLQFHIEVFYDGNFLIEMDLNPLGVSTTVSEVKTQVNGAVNWSYAGKMGSFVAEKDGKYRFTAILISNGNPSLELDKADIILRN